MQFRVHLFLLCSDVIAGMSLEIERNRLRTMCIKHDPHPTLSDWVSAIDKICPPEPSSRICRIATFVVSGTKIHAIAEIAEYLTPISITLPEAIPVGSDILLQDETNVDLSTALTPQPRMNHRYFISSTLQDKTLAIQHDPTHTLIIKETDLRDRLAPLVGIVLKPLSIAPKPQPVKSNPTHFLCSHGRTNAYNLLYSVNVSASRNACHHSSLHPSDVFWRIERNQKITTSSEGLQE